jgi:carbonic anhydrase
MKKLIQGLRRFKSEYFCSHQQLFEQLSHGQHPRVLFVTCSDSRLDPELIVQADPGDIFVIRNAGNIIPPYGATNGGEGATVEYAVQALGIKQIVVCGHSHCGAMKGLLKVEELRDTMPLVYDWLKHAEATRRLIKENYSDRTGEDLLNITIAENVLTQIENLRTYPVIHARLYHGDLKIYAWIYDIDTGEMMAYDAEEHAYVPPQSQLSPEELDEDLLNPPPVVCALDLDQWDGSQNRTATRSSNGSSGASNGQSQPSRNGQTVPHSSQRYPTSRLSSAQLDRIYRGSANR